MQAANRTLGLEKLMALAVPVPPLFTQQSFDRLQSEVAALKAEHAAIRAANTALLPATLERIFRSEMRGLAAPAEAYDVSVLEVVGGDATDGHVSELESRWKEKLGTRAKGLNRN